MTGELYGALCGATGLGIGGTIGYLFGRRVGKAEQEWRDFDESLPLSGVEIHSKKEHRPRPFDWASDLPGELGAAVRSEATEDDEGGHDP